MGTLLGLGSEGKRCAVRDSVGDARVPFTRGEADKTFHVRSACGAFAPVVGISWFGVNLLGAGLPGSYGFENGTAVAVAGFVIADAAVIAGLTAFAARRQPNLLDNVYG